MSHSSVKVDCETLLSRFQETDSVRFENFLEIWRDMKFSHIFLGGMKSLQMVNFTKDALAAACLYLLPPYTFQIRVGALYLLYGLYNTQLCQPKEKIRLSLKDWSEIEDFYQDLVSAQHLDAAHIFRQMRLSRAFHFTAMPTFLSYGSQKPSADNLGKEEFKDTTDRVQDLVSTDMMEELLNIHEHYQKTKCLLSAKSQPDKSLSLIKNEFLGDLKSLMTDHQEWKQEKVKPKSFEEEEKEKGGTSQDSEGSERARALARIKSKSYTSATLAIKSRRHRQVELVSSNPTSSSLKTKKGRKSKKPRRKTMASKDEETELGDDKASERRQSRRSRLPMIPEEHSSSSSDEIPVSKRRTLKRK